MCRACGTTVTPEWRRGPDGPRTYATLPPPPRLTACLRAAILSSHSPPPVSRSAGTPRSPLVGFPRLPLSRVVSVPWCPCEGCCWREAPARGIRPFARLLTPPHAHAMHRLCNACGLYYLKKKQVPQAAVPMALVSRTRFAGTVDLSREKHGAARASGYRADGAGGDGEDAREGCAADAR